MRREEDTETKSMLVFKEKLDKIHLLRLHMYFFFNHHQISINKEESLAQLLHFHEDFLKKIWSITLMQCFNIWQQIAIKRVLPSVSKTAAQDTPALLAQSSSGSHLSIFSTCCYAACAVNSFSCLFACLLLLYACGFLQMQCVELSGTP